MAPPEDSLSWRLIAHLLRRPTWLLGMAGVILAFVLQAVALHFAPVALVEPLIATELVFALPLASRLRRRRLGVREWLGAACVSTGVGLFLAVSDPRGGDVEPGLLRWVVVAGPVLAVACSAVLLARGPETPRRAALLAAAAGLCFGLLSLVTKSFVVLIGAGLGRSFASWQPYALAALGVMSFTIAQSAYQSAPLASSLPIIDSVEPTAAVAFAAVVFGQSLSVTTTALAFECLGALLAVTGIVLLGRSPLVHSVYEQQQEQKRQQQVGPAT